MADSLTAVNLRKTPQTEMADRRQVKNSAGGYTFQVSDETRVHRFLTIGTENGTYYIKEKDLTKENAQVIMGAAADRGEWLVEQIVEISTAGRAPRQNPAIFALAAVSALGDDEARRSAFGALTAVCRTGTHLCLFVKYMEQFRGWGQAALKGVGRWYLDKDPDDLAYQLVKYRQREGWNHRDILRSCHPTRYAKQSEVDPRLKTVFNWLTDGKERSTGEPLDRELLPSIITAFEKVQTTTDERTWIEYATSFPLSWEMFPDKALASKEVWAALILKRGGLPQTALMRQLPRLTRIGVFDNAEVLTTVISQLTDIERLRKGRIHPMNVLVAAKTYASGHSVKGSSTWTPNRKIVDALDASFYAAYGAIEPTNKKTLVALDISGSMHWTQTSIDSINCAEAAAAVALPILAVEPNADVAGFCTQFTELSLSPRQRLDDAVAYMRGLPMGGTDCSLPMVWAAANNKQYDTFIVITDNETYAGRLHPHQALREYRNRSGINAKLVVVGMASTDFTIADPTDVGMLDVAGLDSAVPNLISDFSAGRF